MKKIILSLVFCFLGFCIFAQNASPALEWGGQNSVTHWNEQEVVIDIGTEIYSYLMYNSRNDRVQITRIVFDWFARHNRSYIIDYSNVITYYPNEGLSENVIKAMTNRDCDICFTFIEIDSNTKQLIINVQSNDMYYTTAYYFYELIGGL